MVDEAEEAGADVMVLGKMAAGHSKTRQLPLRLVVSPPESAQLSTEEVFGPIIPIRPYQKLQEAIDYVNSRERPLGLYFYSNDQDTIENVLCQTNSGGVSINCAAMQGSLKSLGFGGSGASGFGRHHGKDGMLEFSNRKGVFVRGNEPDLLPVFSPPYATAEAVAVSPTSPCPFCPSHRPGTAIRLRCTRSSECCRAGRWRLMLEGDRRLKYNEPHST
jgi:coniferyl-aldehyde dehydrogenase